MPNLSAGTPSTASLLPLDSSCPTVFSAGRSAHFRKLASTYSSEAEITVPPWNKVWRGSVRCPAQLHPRAVSAMLHIQYLPLPTAQPPLPLTFKQCANCSSDGPQPESPRLVNPT